MRGGTLAEESGRERPETQTGTTEVITKTRNFCMLPSLPRAASRQPLPAPTQMSAASPQDRLLQVLPVSQSTRLRQAAAVPPEPQGTVRAGLRALHRQRVVMTSALQAFRAQAGRQGSSGLLGEAAGHPILMEVVVVGEVVMEAVAVVLATPTPRTGSVKMSPATK